MKNKLKDSSATKSVAIVGEMYVGDVLKIGLLSISMIMTISSVVIFRDNSMFLAFLLTVIFALWIGGGLYLSRIIHAAPVASLKIFAYCLLMSLFVITTMLLSIGQ